MEKGREYLFLLIPRFPPIDEMTSQGRSSLMTKYDFYSVIDCRMSRLNDSHARAHPHNINLMQSEDQMG